MIENTHLYILVIIQKCEIYYYEVKLNGNSYYEINSKSSKW